MKEALISLSHVSVGYQGHEALKDVSLSVYEKDFIGIIGPNGGGKTSLLKLILGLVSPSQGSISYRVAKRDIGYLPQGRQIDQKFPISVEDVVASGLQKGLSVRGKPTNSEKQEINKVLEMSGMLRMRKRAIGMLSGGELQRTLLARAIVSSPRVLILDEPNTHVDNQFEMELYRILRELNQHMTILLVSHDIGIISPYIKSIACVNRTLHYHPGNEISEAQLKVYNCPIEIITHGTVPHRVMKSHTH
ncbi:MAG: zinc ABC transporter ATP-binding protein [Bacteroidetes bacterium]|nr:MAG: zinc ABC transporter ATP-binding protein [Bacteroidota bacterium]